MKPHFGLQLPPKSFSSMAFFTWPPDLCATFDTMNHLPFVEASSSFLSHVSTLFSPPMLFCSSANFIFPPVCLSACSGARVFRSLFFPCSWELNSVATSQVPRAEPWSSHADVRVLEAPALAECLLTWPLHHLEVPTVPNRMESSTNQDFCLVCLVFKVELTWIP